MKLTHLPNAVELLSEPGIFFTQVFAHDLSIR
jgi:hypothetical protein